jgi:hypothetical protein
LRRGLWHLLALQPRSRLRRSRRRQNGRCLPGHRIKGFCRSRPESMPCCSIGRAGGGGTNVGQFLKTWLPSWTSWGWIDRTGSTRCATSVACSNKRQVERVRLCALHRVAHGASFRARRPRKSRFYRQAARSLALVAAANPGFAWIRGQAASFPSPARQATKHSRRYRAVRSNNRHVQTLAT